jgi:Zn-dependent protease
LFSDPYLFLISGIFLLPAIPLAITGHEMAHAAAAYFQGDRSLRNRGYLTPNFRQFIEPYGLLAILLIRVGWGQPPPINESRLRGLGGQLIYALAGPLANLALAIAAGLALRVLILQQYGIRLDSLIQPSPFSYLTYVVFGIFFLNLAMFAFHLLPIPGLDGWRVVEALFRRRYPRFFFDAWSRRREVWTVCAIAVFVVSFIGPNLLAVALLPIYWPTSTLIVGQCLPYPFLSPCPPSGRL